MLKYSLRIAILLSLFCLAGCGVNTPDIQVMLGNLNNSFPNLWRMVTAFAYVMGFAMAMRALYYMKIYGESRTMMSSHSSIKTPVTYFVVAAALIFSPTMFQTLMQTTFGYTSILDYQGPGTPGWTAENIRPLIHLVQFFGLLAFFRGWMYIARTGGQSSQPGTFGKGITHIFGGVLAINIVGFWNIIKATFGFG